jgi:hypothetical protein
MRQKISSIRDAKAEIFNKPFYQNTHGEAERTFRTIVNDDSTAVSKYPEDYDLWYLGEFDDNSGKAELLDTPQHMIKAIDVQSQNPNQVTE